MKAREWNLTGIMLLFAIPTVHLFRIGDTTDKVMSLLVYILGCILIMINNKNKKSRGKNEQRRNI